MHQAVLWYNKVQITEVENTMNGRGNNFLDGYQPFTQDCVLRTPQLSRLEQLAEGLSREEILDAFDLNPAILCDVDRYNFEKAIKRGKIALVTQSVAALKKQMAGREGTKAALAALTRFGEKWENNDVAAGATKFTLTLD